MDRDRSQRFDLKSKHYKDLQELLKKIIKAEENIFLSRTSFKKKWHEIANIESSQDLSRGLISYSRALNEIERSHRDKIITFRSNVLESLKKYPDRLKEQRRSLSAHSKIVKDFDESNNKLQRMLSVKDQRDIKKERDQIAQAVEEKKNIMLKNSEDVENEVEKASKTHDDEVKNVLMHLMHSKMNYHAAAIQFYTDAFKEVLSVHE